MRFDASPGGDLEIKVGDADVRHFTGSDEAVLVKITLFGRDMERARDFYERQHFDVGNNGNTVFVETDPEENLWRMFRNDWRNHPQILVEVTTPAQFNLRLRTSDGDVYLETLEGDIHASTSDGDIRADGLFGPTVLHSSDGDIAVKNMEGTNLEAHTSDGDLRFETVSAATIELETSDGDIYARTLHGAVTIKTSDGDIEIGEMEGETLTARTSDGDIRFGYLLANDAQVRTSDGDINLEHVEGSLTAIGGDGDLYIGLEKPSDVTLQTSDGDIEINAPASLAADLYLRGDGVYIDRAFEFSGRIDDDHERAEGRLGNGGAPLEARTSDGSIRLHVR